MNILKIPVSPFVRKIILSNYGDEPIRLKASDNLTGELTCVRPGDEAKVEKTLAALTTEITVILTENVARQVNRRRWRIGLRLDDYYREKLNEYIETSAVHNVGATAAITEWCDDHDVELDTDIAFETVYKDWQRYQLAKSEKNTDIFRRKKRVFVRHFVEKSPTKLPQSRLFSDAELDAIIALYIAQNPTAFIGVKGRTMKKLCRQLEIYTYRIIGSHTPQYISRKFGLKNNRKCKRTTKTGVRQYLDFDPTIRYAVRQFKIFLKTAPPMVLPEPPR